MKQPEVVKVVGDPSRKREARNIPDADPSLKLHCHDPTSMRHLIHVIQ